VTLPKVCGAADTLSTGSGSAPTRRMPETAATNACCMAERLAFRASIEVVNDSGESGAGSGAKGSRGARPVAYAALTAMGNSQPTTLARLEY